LEVPVGCAVPVPGVRTFEAIPEGVTDASAGAFATSGGAGIGAGL
jgi:hypothetical protein